MRLMQTIIPSTPALFRKVITPNEQCDNVAIPKEWFGMKVEVILFPIPADAKDAPPPHGMPFRANRRRLESAHAPSAPGLLSENLIRAERDAR